MSLSLRHADRIVRTGAAGLRLLFRSASPCESPGGRSVHPGATPCGRSACPAHRCAYPPSRLRGEQRASGDLRLYKVARCSPHSLLKAPAASVGSPRTAMGRSKQIARQQVLESALAAPSPARLGNRNRLTATAPLPSKHQPRRPGPGFLGARRPDLRE